MSDYKFLDSDKLIESYLVEEAKFEDGCKNYKPIVEEEDFLDTNFDDFENQDSGWRLTDVGIAGDSLKEAEDGSITGECTIYGFENGEETVDNFGFTYWQDKHVVKINCDKEIFTKADIAAAEEILLDNLETNFIQNESLTEGNGEFIQSDETDAFAQYEADEEARKEAEADEEELFGDFSELEPGNFTVVTYDSNIGEEVSSKEFETEDEAKNNFKETVEDLKNKNEGTYIVYLYIGFDLVAKACMDEIIDDTIVPEARFSFGLEEGLTEDSTTAKVEKCAKALADAKGKQLCYYDDIFEIVELKDGRAVVAMCDKNAEDNTECTYAPDLSEEEFWSYMPLSEIDESVESYINKWVNKTQTESLTEEYHTYFTIADYVDREGNLTGDEVRAEETTRDGKVGLTIVDVMDGSKHYHNTYWTKEDFLTYLNNDIFKYDDYYIDDRGIDDALDFLEQHEQLTEEDNAQKVVNKKYRIIMKHNGKELANEVFDSKEEAKEWLDDSYNNWYFDDEEIAENVVYALMCDLDAGECDSETDSEYIFIRE